MKRRNYSRVRGHRRGRRVVKRYIRRKPVRSGIPPVLYHGTSEDRMAQMGFTGGLKPQGGITFLTDNPNYARFKAENAVKGTKLNPVIIEVNTPPDTQRTGRHFITKSPFAVRDFRKLHIGKVE
jgi:hypothetical protein